MGNLSRLGVAVAAAGLIGVSDNKEANANRFIKTRLC